ncbi:MAG: hypothetical protein ACYCUE_00785 [Steroidobacteraceae bacterium]
MSPATSNVLWLLGLGVALVAMSAPAAAAAPARIAAPRGTSARAAHAVRAGSAAPRCTSPGAAANRALLDLAASLAATPSEGNFTRRTLFAAARCGDDLPALSWSLAQDHWRLAQRLINDNPRPPPRWVRLSLALHRRDLTELARLLQRPAGLAPDDRVRAQMQLGRYRQARRDALRALRSDPWDRALRREYLHAVRRSASYLDLRGSWRSFDGLQLYGSRLRARLSLADHWGVLLDADTLARAAATRAAIAAGSPWSSRALVGFYWRDPRWRIRVEAGQYAALRNNFTARLEASWRATSAGTLSAVGDYHARSFESPALALGGMVDRTALEWTQRLGRWTDSLGLGWKRYLGQDGIALGQDHFVEAAALWGHALGPWELQAGPFADYQALARRRAVSGVLAGLLPPGTHGPDALLSGSYADAGVRLQWAAWRRGLGAAWTPYLTLSVYDNTRYGPEYQLGAGISTPILGPDRLRIGFAQGQSDHALALTQRILKIGYRYYF